MNHECLLSFRKDKRKDWQINICSKNIIRNGKKNVTTMLGIGVQREGWEKVYTSGNNILRTKCKFPRNTPNFFQHYETF